MRSSPRPRGTAYEEAKKLRLFSLDIGSIEKSSALQDKRKREKRNREIEK